MNYQEMMLIDHQHLLHPYTSINNPLETIPVKSASGCYLKTYKNGNLLDGTSSWWCAAHGYNDKDINRAVKIQLNKMSHVMFAGLTHEPAVKLTELLLEMLPKGLDTVFLCDSGSVAVEAALKMAFQYWIGLGRKEKKRILTVCGGYHGDTFYAMSVCDPVDGMHGLFGDLLPQHLFAPVPSCKFGDQWNHDSILELKKIIEENHSTIAAFILEPIAQCAGGMNFYHPEYLKEVRKLCDKYEILLIADEIATGFGRTGKLFACEWSGIVPDIMCLGKALTGGYMTLASVVAKRCVVQTVCSGNNVFMHGPTFMGNPLACAAAVASLTKFNNQSWVDQVQMLEQEMKIGLYPAVSIPGIKNVRTLGAIGVIETQKIVNQPLLQKKFVEKGVWVRPFSNLIYIMPPFVMTTKQIRFLTDKIIETVKEVYDR